MHRTINKMSTVVARADGAGGVVVEGGESVASDRRNPSDQNV
jgi:hypothetical protein